MRFYAKLFSLLIFSCLLTINCWAHDKIDVSNMTGTETAWVYLVLGFKHILPLGYDHILFVLSLFLLSPRLKPILWQSAAFTLAHSITLALAMFDVIRPPAAIVEPLIALSILYVALENIFSPQLKPSRLLVVFFFGLIHGMGFAGVLQELGLPEKSFVPSLIMFNVGVEAGQVTVILMAWLLVARWFKRPDVYRSYVVIPLSVIIAVIALTWTVQRVFYT